MYELSEGDPQFLTQFEQHISAARRTLNNSSKIERALFLKRWNTFSPHWKFTYIKSMDSLNLDVVVRNNARQYLTDIFLHASSLPSNRIENTKKIHEIVLYSAILSARSLDLISAHEGSSALSEHDRKIKVLSLAKTVHSNINYLLRQATSKKLRRRLLKVKSQFDFISRYITDYDHKTPYFLMYRSVITMSQLLTIDSQKGS